MTIYRVDEVVRPLPNVFVFPLVKPTMDQHDTDGYVFRWWRHNWWAWSLAIGSELQLGDIWSPRTTNGPNTWPALLSRSDQYFLDLVQRMKAGEFGTKSPPFVFPQQRPMRDMIWIWSGWQWKTGLATDLVFGHLWWPYGTAHDQLYGRPNDTPRRVE